MSISSHPLTTTSPTNLVEKETWASPTPTIGKCIPPLVQIGRMHNPRIVIRRTRLIVRAHVLVIRLDRISQQRAPVERRRQPRSHIPHLSRVARTRRERARGATEDIRRCRLRECANAREGEEVVDDASGEGAPLRLGVDSQGLGSVFLPDCVDVALVVAVK